MAIGVVGRAMLSAFVRWWLQQMLDLVPARWRGEREGPANALVVAWSEAAGGAELLTRRDGREASLGRFALDEAGLRQARGLLGNRRAPAVVLRLPAGLLLERQVTLPLAAELGLDRVVRYEMDRFTPFAAEDVYFSFAVRRRDRAGGRLLVDIALVPRARLAPVIEALAQLRLPPSLLELPRPGPGSGLGGGVGGGGAGEPRRIPLGKVDPRGARWRHRRLVAAAAACAVLAVAAVGLPFWFQAQASDAVEARIAELRPRVAQAEALRRQMAASAEGHDVIGAERQRLGDALRTIATLTDLLADDTYLLGLTIQKRQVTLEGQSAAAAKLLTTLSADPTIRNAAFAAPVTRGESGVDLFSIKAEVTP